ncbi:helix-turn-helix transcriptional regulator [Streptomyces sp. S.PB5]|uniref:helix-turn-helix domain-containing protein n=1 Tax=Streptomyces sp. S.PB5 TaxID=3020844 RepID=UPI0025B052FB|nr:helix-turn-helix transcriptional regulator [Streptomyces sp. S.PB5]MDN3021572.1 helix-turn-helix transcriptional regulator [Streptomyces sp. S.PB5]
MKPSDDAPLRVGQQLSGRREDLDLTQGAVAAEVGITVTSVSSAERGRATISRSKRPLWERALRLKPGTISRAYRDGTDLEPAPEVEAQSEAPYADLSDHLERTAWEMPLSVEDRKLIVDMLRQAKAQGRSERSA